MFKRSMYFILTFSSLMFIGYVLGTVVLALLGVYLGRGIVLMGARP